MLSTMAPFFRKSEEKVALRAAAQTEIDRLKGLSPEELAVLVLPGLGAENAGPGRNLRPQQLCEYLLRDFPGIGQTMPLLLMAPVRRALERLEAAELASSTAALTRSLLWTITSLGMTALAEGTAERRLAAPS
ncbi:MAG TPA: hypothetical protein VGF68_21095 [Solirubrobacteraceae bacterium]|jgi:hypothetical protein